jgi:hypothetical protein
MPDNPTYGVERLKQFIDEDWQPDHDMREWKCPHGHIITFLDADYGESAFFIMIKAAHDQHYFHNPPKIFNSVPHIDMDDGLRITPDVSGPGVSVIAAKTEKAK